MPTSTRGSFRSIPVPPKPFDRLLQIKYVRTIVTQLCYWPLLIRELRRADVVHVFSASYSSFLLAPLPAVIVSRLLGKPVLLNYHSGEAQDHLRRSWIARRTLRRHVDVNVVPSTFLRDVMARFGIAAHRRLQHRRSARVHLPCARPAAIGADASLDTQLRAALQRRVHLARVRAGAGTLSGCVADAGRQWVAGTVTEGARR